MTVEPWQLELRWDGWLRGWLASLVPGSCRVKVPWRHRHTFLRKMVHSSTPRTTPYSVCDPDNQLRTLNLWYLSTSSSDWGRTSPSCIGHAFTMPTTLPLLRENVTYEEARQRETNTLHQLTYPKAQLEFYNFLYRRQILIQKRVAHHLNVPSSTCQVAAPKDWMQGSFNLCIPVTLADSKRVLIRFPLPYRVGDKVCPGNADEKVRCEAATYVWMQKECPRIPIPRLYGFALSSGQCVCPLPCSGQN